MSRRRTKQKSKTTEVANSRVASAASTATTPAVRGLDGEILTKEHRVRVTGSPHPLLISRIDTYVRAGHSLDEIVDLVLERYGDGRLKSEMDLLVNGERVDQSLWAGMRLKAGATLTFIAKAPQKDAIRSIAMIVVAVGALLLSGGAAAPFLGAAFGAGTFGAAILGAAVTIGGMLLVNQLFPIAKPTLATEQEKDTRSVTHSIGGARNEADPWGPVPVVFGRHRVSPKYGAKPYTELNGDDQYLRLFFVWGVGPMDISDLRIGETPISNFEGVEIQTYYGYPGDAQPTLYPAQVIQEDLSIEFATSGDQSIRTTATGISDISVDFVAPQGIYVYDDEKTGERNTHTVIMRIYYRAVGSGSWIFVSDVEFRARSPDVMRRGDRWAVHTIGPAYEVMVARQTGGFNEAINAGELITWTALRGFRPGSPNQSRVPVAVTAMRIKATGQLNGTVDTFNGVVEARGIAWNGSAWVANAESRNPADAFRQALQHAANFKARTNAEIDLVNLQEWWAYCQTENFTYDTVRDFRSGVYELLVDIAAAGRATVTQRDGKWGVVWDDVDAPVAQHLTPRNSWGFSSSKEFRRLPHAWRMRFLNEDKRWEQDERIVYADGYNASNATMFESIEMGGVTKSDLIWRHGRFHHAQLLLRPETYSLSVDMEHIAFSRGDRVRVNHDVPMWGLVAARVKAIAGNVVTLDEIITMESGKTYAIRFRLDNNTTLYRTVATAPGETDVVTLTGSAALPEVGDLAQFGEAGQESVVLRVLSIRPQADYVAQCEFVDDAPEISEADTGAIPPFESNVSIPPDPFTLAPIDIRITESIYSEAGRFVSSARVSWQVTRFTNIRAFEVQYRDVTANSDWKIAATVPAPQTSTEILDLPSGIYSFRVRNLFADNTSSTWIELLDQSLLGLQQPPDNVENFRMSVLGDLTTLSWNPVDAPNLSHYEIRHSPLLVDVTWGSALPVPPDIRGTSTQVPTRPGTYLIKAVTAQGVASPQPTIILSTIEPLSQLNVVEVMEEAPTFAGVKEDVVVRSDLLRLSGRNTLDTWGVLNTVTSLSAGTLGLPGVRPEGIYRFENGIDLGAVYTSRVTGIIDSLAESSVNTMATWETLEGVEALEPADPDDWEVTLQYRSTDDNPNGGDNYATPSEDLTNAAWSKWQSSVTANATTAPDGTVTADRLYENSTTNTHVVSTFVSALAEDEAHCFSVYLKADTRSRAIVLFCDGAQAKGVSATVNLNDLTIVESEFGAGSLADWGIEEDVEGGWYRVWVSGTVDPGSAANGVMMIVYLLDDTGAYSYAGNGSAGMYVWGLQMDRGTRPSRYKRTEAGVPVIGTDPPPLWSDWDILTVGDIKARAMEFRAVLQGTPVPGSDPPYATTTPLVRGLAVSIDMPDRIDAVKDLVVPVTGMSVVFTPPFRTLKGVTFGHQDMAPGDRAEVTGKDEEGFFIQYFNDTDVAIERTTDYNAVGYGIRVD